MMFTQLNTSGRRGARRSPLATALVPAVVVAIALSGCAAASENAAEGAGAEAPAGDGPNIVIMGGATDDPFWSTVKRGGEAAAAAVEAAGGTVTFLAMPNYDNFNADAAKLVANMQGLEADAVIIPNWVPDAQNANIKALSGDDVPVIIYNSGFDTVEEVGAEIYIGSDDYTAGVAGGEQLASLGAKNIVCVNTLPGAVNSEARCSGVADGATEGGSKGTALNLPTSQFGDPTAVTQAIKGALLNDPTIDALITIGTTDADSAAAAIEQAGAGDKVSLGTFDVSEASLERIKGGTQAFSIDQQPYAQGYYAVSYAFQLAAYGIYLPESPLLTGPALITPENVDFAISGAKLGVR